MAVLTTAEKVLLRNATERKAIEAGIPVAWVKGAINDAVQAVEDILDGASFKSAVSSAIDTASAPYGVTFTANQKRWIAALVMEVKYTRDIVG